MKTARDYLKAEVDRKLGEARAISQKADDENRQMSDDERARVEAALGEATGLKARVEELEANEKLQASIDALGQVQVVETHEGDRKAKTIGEQFAKSDAYQALKASGMSGRWTTGAIEVGFKANEGGVLVEGEGVFGDSVATVLQSQVLPGVQTPVEQKLYVADLFGSGTATQNTIVYLREISTDNSAGIVDEAGEKPASFLDFQKASVAIEKLATFLPVSDEMIEDEPAIASYINGRLGLFVKQAEETKLVAELLAAGIGTAVAADLDGGTNAFDAIAAGIMSVQVDGGLEPDAVLINPVDFWSMAVTKAVGGAGDYFSGGPYAAAARNPWGLRAVVTTAVAAGTPIVGAFNTAATVWRKGGLTIEASNSHADYFRKNLTAIRAEERIALAVYRPAAFVEVTLP